MYGFGSARRGQVGKCVSRNQKTYNVPRLIDGFPNCKLVSIYANGDHSAALDSKISSSVVVNSHLLISLEP